jgi:hypothetical protein
MEYFPDALCMIIALHIPSVSIFIYWGYKSVVTKLVNHGSCFVIREAGSTDRYFTVFLNHFRQIPDWCIKIGHDRFIPYPFQFIIN